MDFIVVSVYLTKILIDSQQYCLKVNCFSEHNECKVSFSLFITNWCPKALNKYNTKHDVQKNI